MAIIFHLASAELVALFICVSITASACILGVGLGFPRANIMEHGLYPLEKSENRTVSRDGF